MPSQEASAPPPPSAATIAWNWVVEELAACEEFDSSIFAALMRWDRSTVGDPVQGARAMERLVLKYMEELVGSTEFLTPAVPESAADAMGVMDQGINVATSSESILRHYSQEVGQLNSTGSCENESCRNVLRQVILQKRAALHKSSLDLLKDMILEDCRQGVSSSSHLGRLVRADQGNSLHTDNADKHERVSKRLKLSNSHIQQATLLSSISSEPNQNLLLKEVASRHENQPSKQKVECTAPESPVGKNKMLQSSSPTEAGNNIQSTDVSSDGGQKVLSDSSSDGEGYYDAVPDFHQINEIIAAERLKLMNSLNPVNNGSQTGDWTQQRSCIKCDKGGQVLICMGNECLIAVHERCLGSSVDTEKLEDFKCPICSYLLAASAFQEARNKVFAACKNLYSFFGQERMRPKKAPQTLARESRHARKPSNGNRPDKVCVNQRSEIIKEPERQGQAKTAIDGNNGNLSAGQGHTLINKNNDASPPSGETGIVNEHRIIRKSQHHEQAVLATVSNGLAQHKVPLHKGENRTGGNCHFTRITRHHLPGECKSAVVSNACHADVGTSQIMETDNGSSSPQTGDSEPSDGPCCLEYAQGLKHQERVGSGSDTVSLPCQEIHVECDKVKKPDPAIEHVDWQNSSKIVEHSSDKGRKPKNSTRHTKRYTNPMFPCTRRNRLPWTSEEEEILKEAMRNFYPNGESNISWIKIWEFGQHTFHKTRQPADLKNKWRNIRMREGENWKRKI